MDKDMVVSVMNGSNFETEDHRYGNIAGEQNLIASSAKKQKYPYVNCLPYAKTKPVASDLDGHPYVNQQTVTRKCVSHGYANAHFHKSEHNEQIRDLRCENGNDNDDDDNEDDDENDDDDDEGYIRLYRSYSMPHLVGKSPWLLKKVHSEDGRIEEKE